ncbi:general transcription factor 3C polypeptide 6 [Eurosta solidaginis]|uniref:general transcription factor 3C polypeptide 6 n=1 Tax=Eurosta solidaginis TaxID=178769 RepID=UPI0035306D10
MNANEESDYEEEEILVYADFKNQLAPLELSENAIVKIIGFEEDPIAEVNGNVFKGAYDYPMGTCVFFEKDVDANPSDPLFENSCRQKFKYTAKTNKVINFERIFVEKKILESTEDQLNENISETSTEEIHSVDREKHERLADSEKLRVNMSYEEAIKLFKAHDSAAV